MTRRKRTDEGATAKVVKKVKAKAVRAAEATVKAARAAVSAAEEFVVEPVSQALGLTPKKPKVEKVRKRHVRPPKRTPAVPRPEREAPKTAKARTLTHSVAKSIPKAGAKKEPR
jgi:hypothetical protein